MKLALLAFCFLFAKMSFAQKCDCGPTGRDPIATIKEKVNGFCNSCELDKSETVLIYDAKCKKFYYRECLGDIKPLNDLTDFRLQYKKPFRIKIINFNRYLYNVNLGNSDIAFTSTQSAVMQQYLLPGAGNGQVTPYNSYSNGLSENGGDYVFSIIAAFKANLDFLKGKVFAKFDAQKNIPKTTQIANQTSAIVSLKALQTLLIRVTELNNYSKSLDEIGEEITKIQNCVKNSGNCDTAKLPSLFKSYTTKAEAIIRQISTNSKKSETYDKIKSDPNFKQFKINVDTLVKASANNELKQAADSAVWKADSLKKAFSNLEKYYNSFIDNKITAYSVCSYNFPCCTNSGQATYTLFNELLTAISGAFYDLKSQQASIAATAKSRADAVEKSKEEVKPEPKPKPTILKVNTSDIVIENGKITGLTLHQIPETEKPDKPTVVDPLPFADIDSLWFLFEKSISTDYIMRQILFNNNMLSQNMSYTSPPIFPYGDRLGLVLQISPSDSVKKMGIMPTSTETISLDFPVYGKAMFSFSAGTFFGLSSKLKSPTYEWQQIPTPGSNTIQTNSPYTLQQTGNGSLPIGVDGLANITWRVPLKFSPKTDFRLGISGGVGAVVDPTPVRLAYLLGATGSLGTYQQFHFTVGYMAFNVNQLKDNLITTGNINYATSPGNIQYNQSIKGGVFFSLSYTLFNLKTSGTAQNGVINGTINTSGITATPAK